jgi:hypothetical protein
LVNIRHCRRISILYQQDGFGLSGLSALSLALSNIGMTIKSLGSYKRNTLDILAAFNSISLGSPDAIVMFGTSAALGQFVKLVNTNTTFYPQASTITFAAVSFTELSTFISMMAPYANNTIVTQVVPPISLLNYQVVREYSYYHNLVDTTTPLNPISLEGYVVGKLTTIILSRTPNIGFYNNRTAFINTFYETVEHYIGGLLIGPYSDCTSGPVQYPLNSDTCSCNQGMRSVYAVAIQNGMVSAIPSAFFSWQGTCFINSTTQILQPITFGHVSVILISNINIMIDFTIRFGFNI